MNEAEATRMVRARYGVPDTVELEVDARRVLAWRDGAREPVLRVARAPDDVPAGRARGRSALGRLEDDAGALLVRPYRKGGLLRVLRGSRFRGRLRPLDELVLHVALGRDDVPVAEAVGCVVLGRGARGWRGFLLLREVADALDLEAFLHGAAGAEVHAASAVLQEAGRAVRALHDAGVRHPDLHPKNLLVTPDGAVLALDLDRARRRPAPLDERGRLDNLVRLGRAVEKHRLKGLRTGRREALRFLEGYTGDRAAAAHLLERVRARLGRGLALRRMWWRLNGEARPWGGGTGPEPAGGLDP